MVRVCLVRGVVCGSFSEAGFASHDDDFSAKDYYRALRYTIGRANVLNLSLGGEKDDAEIDVLRDVIDAGVVVVAAMGNEFDEGNPMAGWEGIAVIVLSGALSTALSARRTAHAPSAQPGD